VNKKQRAIITGSMLGDGYITNPPYGNSSFVKKMCKKSRPYLVWHFKELKPYSSRIGISRQVVAGKRYKQFAYATRSNPLFTKLRNLWYPNGKKIIPHGLKLNSLSLAIWFCDDGSNDWKCRDISFAAQAFLPRECLRLVKLLKDIGISSSYQKDGSIRVNVCSYIYLLKMISRHTKFWPCFYYKTDMQNYISPEKTRLTNAERKEIVKRYASGETQSNIADAIGKSLCPVSNCLRKIAGFPEAPLNNTSGTKWVCWEKGREKWRVVRVKNCRKIYLGRFSDKRDAVLAAQRSKEETGV
jgi:hypothetical protein